MVGKERRREQVNEDWYWELRGETAYDKLLEFRQNHLKTIKIAAYSKRLWDDYLTKQLKKVKRFSRGGKSKSNERPVDREKKLHR